MNLAADRDLFDLHLIPGFLPSAECASLRQLLAAAPAASATVQGHAPGAAVNDAIRRTRLVEAPAAVLEDMVRRFEALMPLLSRRFGLALESFESPQFLRYRPGDFFVAHQDGNTGLLASDRQRPRRVSCVLFVNAWAAEGGAGPSEFEGGELVFTEWHPARRNGSHGHAPRAGELVAFPSETTHEVRPVARGERYSVVTWYR